MAATAYSSLVSLMNVLTRYQHPACLVSFDQSQIQTLIDKVGSLVEFLEIYYDSQTKIKTNRVSIQHLERKMTRAANAAEDIIESYYVKQVLDGDRINLYAGLTLPYDFIVCSDQICRTIQEMDQIFQESMEVGVKKHKSESYNSMGTFLSLTTDSNQNREESGSMPKHQVERGTEHKDSLTLTLAPTPVSQLPNPNEVFYDNISTSSSSSSVPRDKDVMVGFDEQLHRLMDQIRISNHSLQIIPIVGMGGIGKTTLARNAYEKLAHCHFDIRAWVTISQQYDVKKMIASLLHESNLGGNDQMEVEQLGDKLYKGLCGRKYFIVLDDIWNIQPWNEIKRFFPDQGNGSRILLTTRDHSVAHGAGSSSTYEMKFLDDDESFNLLSKMVYGPEVFPRVMEILGKKIAKSCKGLPLAVVVIGGLLKTCSKTLEYWKDFAENISSIISNKDNSEQCLGILSLSYSHLPIHLKPCFLHMATFQEDEEIYVSELINLWIAEGFLKPTNDKISNEIALEYLTDLIDRNLIMVESRGRTRKIEAVIMHDLLRELCLAEAKNEDFLCVVDKDTPNLQQRLECERRIVCRPSICDSKVFLSSSMLHARSLNVTGWLKSPQLASLCGLSRVINITGYSELDMNFVKLVNISYLSVTLKGDVGAWLSCSLPLCTNLETLILSFYSNYERLSLPAEIWEFPHLRHLEYQPNTVILPGPTGGQSNCVLENLQTIRGIKNLLFTDEVIRRIPNLKELCITYDDKDGLIDYGNLLRSFTNLALLPKLEIRKARFDFRKAAPKIRLTSFSPNLVELVLTDSRIPWEDMTIVGCLPNLQVLFLEYDAFCGNEWNPIEGEFQSLKYLSIVYCRLSKWNAESYHFPRLEHLLLLGLDLKEIPLGIGEIQSLEYIELYSGEISILKSIKEILEDRRNNQGDDDDLVVKGSYYGERSEEAAEVKKWAEAHKNFQILFPEDEEDEDEEDEDEDED